MRDWGLTMTYLIVTTKWRQQGGFFSRVKLTPKYSIELSSIYSQMHGLDIYNCVFLFGKSNHHLLCCNPSDGQDGEEAADSAEEKM